MDYMGGNGVDGEMMHTWLNIGLTYFHGSWLVAGHMNERLQQKMCTSGLHLIDGSHLADPVALHLVQGKRRSS
jgi:hypothetical protein